LSDSIRWNARPYRSGLLAGVDVVEDLEVVGGLRVSSVASVF
jgi:hypothetical protein